MNKGWYVTGLFPEDSPKAVRAHIGWLETRVGSDHPPSISTFQEEVPEFHKNYITAWWSGQRFTKLRYRDNNGTLVIKRIRKISKPQEVS